MNAQKAFEVILGELQNAMIATQNEGTQAFQQGKFAAAQAAAKRAETIQEHIQTMKTWQENWTTLISGTISTTTSRRHEKPRPRTHLSPGTKTTNKAFRIPILKTLEELGGKGHPDQVLEIVGQKMKDQLKPIDFELLTDGRTIRWRNTAQWERYYLKKQGLIRPDSPTGVWEISEKGRQYLLEHNRIAEN